MRHISAVRRFVALVGCACGVASCDAPARPSPTAAGASATADAASPLSTATAAAAPPAVPATAATPEASLIEIRPVGDGREGRFEGRDRTGQAYTLVVATRHRPRPHPRPVAAYRLARALGLRAVPHTTTRRLPVGSLAALLDSWPDARRAVEQRARVGNDGAIDVLLQQRCPGRPLHVGAGPELDRLARLAASTGPLDGAAQRAVRDYVEMVVLDYLTGNVLRRTVMLDERTGRLCLDDNGGAFPGYLSPAAQDLLLDRLRPIARFPRDLAAALERLDRPTARRLLQSGGFSQWLVGPRELTDLAERRATLASRLHALSHQHGKELVLSLE